MLRVFTKVLYTLAAMVAVFLRKRNQPVALLERGAGGHCKNDQMRKPEAERVERVNTGMEAIMTVAVAAVMPGLVSNVAPLPTRSYIEGLGRGCADGGR